MIKYIYLLRVPLILDFVYIHNLEAYVELLILIFCLLVNLIKLDLIGVSY